MIVKKTLPLKSVYEFAGHHLLWLTAWMTLVTCIYHFSDQEMVTLPWLPVSLIGTAVAFYVGFKNNQSYDRLWEARKIWGDIAGNSKTFATMVKNYRSDVPIQPDDSQIIRIQLIHRHIAYLYQLREQLLEPAQWEHVSLHNYWRTGYYNRQRRAELNNRFKKELDEIAARNYISIEEKSSLHKCNNKAAQLLDMQSHVVQLLYANKTFNMIQQIDIQHTINVFYDEQSKVERIKQTPFPRKYASFSFLFVCIFIFVLPFGIVSEFNRLGELGIWLSIPVGAVVGWVYVVMEMIGDYSENPFEGLHNDAPMLAICRDIEIDMLQMICEKNIPEPIQPKGHVLL